jgi:archaellum biogenesis ATPase FlaH
MINGIINNITPNPASNNISVSYMLSEYTPTAMIQIMNNLGIVLNSTIVTNNQTEVEINISSFVKGLYTLSLVTTNGELIDRDILVIQ